MRCFACCYPVSILATLPIQVYGLPALILFKEGKAVVKREGAISKKLLVDWLKDNGVAPA